MRVYYNDNDPKIAAWLRQCIAAGLVPQGDVDHRSITDIDPADLAGYDQCRFFAGVGGWAYALRLAGWPDDEPVWTGSCPCQPLSSAGLRKGHADQRHLWPAFQRLIAECGPPVVIGEQVASADGREWLAAVRADLEVDRYACGAADLCSAGVGAPHIRQRLYWVADTTSSQSERQRETSQTGPEFGPRRGDATGGLADRDLDGLEEGREGRATLGHGATVESDRRSGGVADAEYEHRRQRGPGSEGATGPESGAGAGGCSGAGGVGNAPIGGVGSFERQSRADAQQQKPDRGSGPPRGASPPDIRGHPADWLFCRDGKWRPVEPGTFPLAAGLPARVVRLRGYGNAIDPYLAAEFVMAFRAATGRAA